MITKKRLSEIKSQTKISKDFAERIMRGDFDGYDGADGAREVIGLCELIDELLIEIEE